MESTDMRKLPKRKILQSHHPGLQTRMILLVCLLVLTLTLVAGGMYTAMIGEILEEKITIDYERSDLVPPEGASQK